MFLGEDNFQWADIVISHPLTLNPFYKNLIQQCHFFQNSSFTLSKYKHVNGVLSESIPFEHRFSVEEHFKNMRLVVVVFSAQRQSLHIP